MISIFFSEFWKIIFIFGSLKNPFESVATNENLLVPMQISCVAKVIDKLFSSSTLKTHPKKQYIDNMVIAIYIYVYIAIYTH